MKTQNIVSTTFILLFSLSFFGTIGLTSCEKENEITKTELGEAISDAKPDEKEDSTKCQRIDYTTEIITSNWIIKDRMGVYGGGDIDFLDENFGIVADNTNLRVYQADAHVRITYDGGETWITKTAPMRNINKLKALEMDKFIISGRGIYESKNGGTNYSVYGHENNINKTSTYNFHIFDSLHFLTQQSGSLEITTNGGEDWVRFRDVHADNIQFFGRDLGYIAGGYVAGGTVSGVFSKGYIYKTVDGGNSWERLHLMEDKITAMYFTDENTGIFADRKGILYKTTDGGSTCTIINEALCGYYPWDMLFIDENVGYLASSYGLIFKTEDGGYTWKVDYYSGEKDSSGYDLDFIALAKTPNNAVYVTGYATMKRVE